MADLDGEDPISVHLEERALGQLVHRKSQLDAGVAEPLTETARDEHERGLGGRLHK